jgi:hypothetical protein
MPPVGPMVTFPPPAVVVTVAEKEAAGVAAVDPGAAEDVVDPGAAAIDAAAVDGATAPEDGDGSVWDCPGADAVWLDEQPTTATAAKTAQAVAILTLVGRAMS